MENCGRKTHLCDFVRTLRKIWRAFPVRLHLKTFNHFVLTEKIIWEALEPVEADLYSGEILQFVKDPQRRALQVILVQSEVYQFSKTVENARRQLCQLVVV